MTQWWFTPNVSNVRASELALMTQWCFTPNVSNARASELALLKFMLIMEVLEYTERVISVHLVRGSIYRSGS